MLPDMALCSYVGVVVPLGVVPVPLLDIPAQGPEVEDTDWLVVLEDEVLDVDVVSVWADAKVSAVRAARTATVMTAAARTVLLSVLNVRLILFHLHVYIEPPSRN